MAPLKQERPHQVTPTLVTLLKYRIISDVIVVANVVVLDDIVGVDDGDDDDNEDDESSH